MNKSGRIVRKRSPDRRVSRTQRALTQALVALVLERRYDAITIQALLDRADVGRSTFYAHYRSKDDLLLQSFAHLLAILDLALDAPGSAVGPAPGRVAPVRELFRHVGEFGAFHRALARARMLDRLYQAGVNHVTATIERRLHAPTPIAARALAGALFALLRWWVDHEAPFSPERMDAMFHDLVQGVGGAAPAVPATGSAPRVADSRS